MALDDIQISKGFRGSANLKRAGEKIQWTQERQLEYFKCSQDPIYFCETYMKIVHVDRGLVPFKLYEYQKEMIMSMWKNRNTVITTARQIGKSTVTCGFILWYVLFHNDKTVALLANKGDTAREIMGKISLAYEHLPKWIQQGVLEANKGSMALENNSRIIAAATSGSAIRGYSINLLFIDEAAFIENWEEFFTAVAPTISSGTSTKIILVSTPNGLNHYFKLWTNAVEGRTDYHAIKVIWSEVPGRDEKWKQKTLADLDFDEDKFAQENEAEFLGSSGTLIRGQVLKDLVHQEPINQIDEVIRQYELPIEGHIYAIICDVSKGVGLDNSAFSVFDITEMPYRQVATFYDNMTMYGDYSDYIHQFAKLYNDAVVLVEINNLGESVARMLWEDFEYEGLLCTENAGSRGKEISTKGPTARGVDKGLNTTQVTKRKGCSMLKLLVENQRLILNDYNTIYELSRFSKKGTSYEAEPGANDDLVMGLVIFAWLTDQRFFKELTDINTLQSIRQSRAEQLENDLIPFGIILQNGVEVDPNKPESVRFDKQGIAHVGDDMFDKFLVSETNDFELEKQFQKLFG